MGDLSRESVADAIQNQNPEAAKPTEIEVAKKTNFLPDAFKKAVTFVSDVKTGIDHAMEPIKPGQGATSVDRYKMKNPGEL